jgi:hypothetical protein
MKRCPECRRNYYDDTLLYCLDDGNALLEGPATDRGLDDEPKTAILSEVGVAATWLRPDEAKTRTFVHATQAEAEPQENEGDLSEKQSFPAHRAAGRISSILGLLGHAYAAAERRGEALKIVDELREMSRHK